MRSRYKHFVFTGTHKGTTDAQRVTLTKQLNWLAFEGFLWMHNGDCIGADDEAALLWHTIKGSKIQLHPPSNSSRQAHTPFADVRCEPKPYLIRDLDMVLQSELCIATPAEYTEQKRGSGTWATIRYARKHRLRVIIIYPDGSVEI